MENRIKVDLHTHTYHSVDSLTREEVLIEAARKRGLGKVAVTDHNAIQGAIRAHALAPELVIVGEEILTKKGEMLGYFLQEEIPSGLSPMETIKRLQAQGAVISIPHAFDPFRSSWSRQDLEELAPHIDAIEVFNARCFTKKMNQRAREFASEHELLGTAGSDGHWHKEVGNGYLVLPDFSTAEEMRASMKKAEVGGSRAPFWVRFYSSYVRFYRILHRRT